MRDVTVSDIDQLTAADAADVAFEMDEEAFRGFYDRTARALWAYLSRISGDPHLADDLLQETYFRFLRARVPHEGEAHRRNYLFRIATNLVRDAHRRRLTTPQSVAVIIHGGCWLKRYDLKHAAREATALTAMGIATWTIEYR
ncbi:MAG: RNA polymerase sigma factor, partial [Acidobacteriota bacterium]